MSPRGGWRGGGRPLKSEDEKRVHFGCRLKPETAKWIEEEKERSGLSKGEIVDHLIDDKKKK